MNRILLSVPHMSGFEIRFVQEAFATNWLSTVGPNLDAFEMEFSKIVEGLPCVALASGTAAIHLGLRALGVGPEDEVICPTLTFVATANPILYLGAKPVFVGSDAQTWNLSPQVLADVLAIKAAANHLPKAVIVVHLFGQSADMDPIMEICHRYGIPVLEDAAEACGTQYKGKPVGTFGDVSAFSFNGNKMITTTGGGMLVARDPTIVDRVRFWSTQARTPGLAYHHTEMGYNYRLSNVLAGIGRGQLMVLQDRVRQRRDIALRYQAAFADLKGISLMPQAGYGLHTNWLSCFLIDPQQFGATRNELITALDEAGIESRPVWKPMHLQPLFEQCEQYGTSVAEDVFSLGICLPSSSSLSEEDQDRVIKIVRQISLSSDDQSKLNRKTFCSQEVVVPDVHTTT